MCVQGNQATTHIKIFILEWTDGWIDGRQAQSLASRSNKALAILIILKGVLLLCILISYP